MPTVREVDPLPGVTLNATCPRDVPSVEAATTTHCTPTGTVVSATSTSTTSPRPPPLAPAGGAAPSGTWQAAPKSAAPITACNETNVLEVMIFSLRLLLGRFRSQTLRRRPGAAAASRGAREVEE